MLNKSYIKKNTVAVENKLLLRIVSAFCGLKYPARNAHAPYCHLWLVRLYNIFPHHLINWRIFGKNVTGHKMCVVIFSKKFV
jgi:hypothetical protein